ncbi:hypothetical protein J4573_48675 [Actinomadura barringtoniae]|uniref:DUF4261 domain-containing protein n=1 Tax=Actinomadura barringtoniae TaxID=1427535 RepID=A0A939PLA3_9ACTN|nr:hypothetical protein [Actinomadura barringtoniae]MBO2455037.1 hypothetical protein [Actinomadura barringtoniae]
MSDDLVVLHPRHVLCALGEGLDLDAIEALAEEAGFELDREYSETEPDPRMPRAFEASLARASFEEGDWDAVEGHDSVAYLVSRQIFPFVAVDVARWTLELTAKLLRSGVTAVKNESNGLTHGRERWLELAEGAAAQDKSVLPLYLALVKRPIADDGLYYSCGMHLLGQPDIEIAWDGEPDAAELARLIDGMALYMLTEERAEEMREGEGFRLSEDEPRWIISRVECDRYEDDDIFFNPYGFWRLTPA